MTVMKISQLARRTGVSVTTLRYYEAEGLLPAIRAGNGYRTYDQTAVDRLAFINHAKALELPLREIRDLVQVREAQPCDAVRDHYRPMLDRHLSEVEDKINRLHSLRSTIIAARRWLDELPERDTSCDEACLPDADSGPDIACSLDGADLSRRVEAWRSLVAGAPRTDIVGGYRFRLDMAELHRAVDLAAAEHRCCPFFRIGFSLQGTEFALEISAPAEAAGMLSDLFGADGS